MLHRLKERSEARVCRFLTGKRGELKEAVALVEEARSDKIEKGFIAMLSCEKKFVKEKTNN